MGTDRQGTNGRLVTVARFERARDARRAIDRLSRRGVDGQRLSLSSDDGASNPRAQQRRADAGASRRLGVRLGQGAAIGAAAGAVIGLAIIAWLVGTDAMALLVGAGAGLFAGAGLGALAGLQSAPTMSRAWAASFAARPEQGATLRVQHGSDDGARRIRETLREAGAVEVRPEETAA